MSLAARLRIVAVSPVLIRRPTGGPVVHHPETMLRLARERQDRYAREAQEDRLVRAARSAARQERRERFSVRDLRWLLFRSSHA